MIPHSLTLTGFRCIDSLEWEIEPGASALLGANGSGKSSRLVAIEYALFGPAGRSHAPLLKRGSTEMSVAFEFDHDEERYRIRRGYSARGAGKSWVSLDLLGEFSKEWQPLTRETAAETQAHIEGRIGISRSTWRSSAYSPQDAGSEWTQADPASRKAVLSDALGLSEWDVLLAEAKKRRASVERKAMEERAVAAMFAEAAMAVAEIDVSLSEARAADLLLAGREVGLQKTLPELQRAAREAHTAAAQAGSRVQALKDARARREAAVEQRDGLVARIDAAHDQMRGVESAERSANDLVWIERQQFDHMALADQARADAEARRGRWQEQERIGRDLDQCLSNLRASREEQAHAVLRRDLAMEPTAACPVCKQEIHGEARAETLRQLEGAVADAGSDCDLLVAESDQLRSEWESAKRSVGPEIIQPDPTELRRIEEALAHSRKAREIVAAAAGWRAQLEQWEQEREAISRTLQSLDEECERAERAAATVPGALEALESAERALKEAQAEDGEIRRKRTEATADVARLTAEIDQARERARTAEAAGERAAVLEGELAALLTVEKGYGRDGVPSLIVETVALPAIQTEANRVLERLGTPLRVDLRTQRVTKGGDVRDALDIIVHTPSGESEFESLSGGERTRVNVGLRIGLARLLATRRGAEIGMFAVDEPDGLDQDGADRLAQVLKELAASTFHTVILVSHQDGLRDSLDHTIQIAPSHEIVEVAA